VVVGIAGDARGRRPLGTDRVEHTDIERYVVFKRDIPVFTLVENVGVRGDRFALVRVAGVDTDPDGVPVLRQDLAFHAVVGEAVEDGRLVAIVSDLIRHERSPPIGHETVI